MHGKIYIADALELDHPLNRGLVSRWKALPGQQRGVKFRDLRKRNDGTLTNGPTWVAGGRRGGYGELNFVTASSQYVDCGVSLANQLISRLAISCWINLASVPLGTFNGIVTTSLYDVNTGWELITVNNSTACYFVFQQTIITYPALNTREWYHLVAIYDGSNLLGYLNGNLVASTARSTDTTAPGNNLLIGKGYGSGRGYFDGKIDDVCIYNRGISAREVSQLYQEQLRGSPETLKWYKRKAYSFADVAGGNRRRRVICGAA